MDNRKGGCGRRGKPRLMQQIRTPRGSNAAVFQARQVGKKTGGPPILTIP